MTDPLPEPQESWNLEIVLSILLGLVPWSWYWLSGSDSGSVLAASAVHCGLVIMFLMMEAGFGRGSVIELFLLVFQGGVILVLLW